MSLSAITLSLLGVPTFALFYYERACSGIRKFGFSYKGLIILRGCVGWILHLCLSWLNLRMRQRLREAPALGGLYHVYVGARHEF